MLFVAEDIGNIQRLQVRYARQSVRNLMGEEKERFEKGL